MIAIRHIALLLVAPLLVSGALWASSNDDEGTFDFAMQDLDGQTHRLSDYRGRWVILNYWATWCPPCVEELPELAAFQAANPQHQVLGINFEDIDPELVRRFGEEHGINFPVLPTGPEPPTFTRLRGLPTTQIVNPAGKLVADHVGTVTRQMLEDFIQEEQQGGAPAAANAN
jgi:thiol-disulfide isomerase/thioredoxin